jgi:hypothetical protein
MLRGTGVWGPNLSAASAVQLLFVPFVSFCEISRTALISSAVTGQIDVRSRR